MAKKKIRKRNKKIPLLQAVSAGPRVLLDSSFVIAFLDEKDHNHECVESLYGFIGPYSCRFHIPLYVVTEVISKFVQRKKRVSEALNIVDSFLSGLRGTLAMGSPPTIEEVIKRYKDLARKKIKFLQSNDFFIVTEGMLSGSLMLTCDFDMYSKVKKYYPDIFFVAAKSKKYKGDIPKFTKRFLDIVK